MGTHAGGVQLASDFADLEFLFPDGGLKHPGRMLVESDVKTVFLCNQVKRGSRKIALLWPGTRHIKLEYDFSCHPKRSFIKARLSSKRSESPTTLK